MPSRRALLAGLGVAFAGCAGGPSTEPSPSSSELPSASDSPTPGARPTFTPRDPRSLDVSGAWRQAGGNPRRSGATDAVGVPEDGTAYWHLPRIRSDTPVVDAGDLYHVGKVGDASRSPPTRTRTRTEASTAHPVFGRQSLFSRRASDGELLRVRPFEWRGRPALTDDLLLAPGEGRLVAFERGGGDEAWSVDFDAGRGGTPTVADGTALVPVRRRGTADLVAYRTDDGTERWRIDGYDGGPVAAVADGTVYVAERYAADGGSRLEARRLADGSARWTSRFSEPDVRDHAVSAETVYVHAGETLVAVDLDGQERWAVPSDGRGLAAADEVVFHVSEGSLYARGASDGSERWVATADDGEYRGAPTVGGEAVYAERAADGEASLVVLGRGDGTERWSFEFPTTVVEGDMVTSGLESRPVVLDGAMYARAVDGLYAFGPA